MQCKGLSGGSNLDVVCGFRFRNVKLTNSTYSYIHIKQDQSVFGNAPEPSLPVSARFYTVDLGYNDITFP